MPHVTLRVHEDGADDERIEQLTGFLRTELQELVPVSGVSGEAAEGAKAIDLAELGTLLAMVSQSTVLAALINAVSAWLGQRRERSVTVEADGDPLELTGAPTDAERARAAQWLERRRLRRHALIIASYEFADPGLSALRAPAHDAARLGEVLADPRIGGFDVRTLINSSAAEVNEAVEDFFADREPDDLLVLHFSGHGVKDEAGELHFATSGTKLTRLAGTAVSADFVARRMNRSRSRRIVLLLDCCYSGAFGRGMVARAGGSVGLEEQFGGSGRAVITASSSMEYAFEGAAVADSSEGEPSVFTSALVEGLESGDADRDQDGHVGLDELYEYVYDRVRRVTPHQTPGKWMLDVRGDLRIARRARPVSVPAALPSDLQEAIDHSLPGVRAGAIPELRRMLTVAHEGRVLAARLALRRLVEDDSRMVSAAAREALGGAGEWTDLDRPAVPAPTSLMAARDSAATDRAAGRGEATGASLGRSGGSGVAGTGGATGASSGRSGGSGAAGTGAATGTSSGGSGAAATGGAIGTSLGRSGGSGGAGTGGASGTSTGRAGGSGAAGTDAAARTSSGRAGGSDAAAASAAVDSGSATGAAEAGTDADHAHAGVPSDREPPHSTLPGGSDTAAKPETAGSAGDESTGRGRGPRQRLLAAFGADSAASGPITGRVSGSGSAGSATSGPVTGQVSGSGGAGTATSGSITRQGAGSGGAGSATSGPITRQGAGRGGTGSATPGGPDDSATGSALSPASISTALSRLVAGLALTLLVFGLATTRGGVLAYVGDTDPTTVLFGMVWPWALVAAMFVLTCRDHPWVPGAALGLLAGTAGMLAGTIDQYGSRGVYWWLLLGLAAVVAAAACHTSPWWLGVAGGVLGAAGVYVVGSSVNDLASIDGDTSDLAFLAAVIGLVGLAGYRVWREKAWLSLGPPVLLLLDAVLTLSNVPQYVMHASLAGLVVVPLIATLTSGKARFAGYLTVAAGLLVRANEYISTAEPFMTAAHLLLPLAAAVTAYFSRSR